MDHRYGFIGTFVAESGRRDELVALLLHAAEALEGNADCLLYLIAASDDDAGAVVVTEMWTSKAAHDASLESEEVRATVRPAMPLIAAIPERRELRVLGGKGFGGPPGP